MTAAGCRCGTWTPRRSRDIFHVRAALEALAARELCALPDRADAVATLRKAVAEMERWAASNLEDRIEADLRFHRTMCQLTGNETLLHQWTSLEGSIRMSIMYAGVDRAIKNMDAKRHHDIVDAIETGDPDTAAETVHDHMTGAAKVLVEGAADTARPSPLVNHLRKTTSSTLLGCCVATVFGVSSGETGGVDAAGLRVAVAQRGRRRVTGIGAGGA